MDFSRAGPQMAQAVALKGLCAHYVRPAAMLEWLTGGPALLPDGRVLSWASDDDTAYPYTEAAAWLLGFLSSHMPTAWAVRARVANALAASQSQCAGAGRDGRVYAFDTGIVLDALIAHSEAGGQLPDPNLTRRIFGALTDMIDARCAVLPVPLPQARVSWSGQYGSHMLRLVSVLLRFSRSVYSTPDDTRCARALAMQLLDDLLPLFDGRRFRNYTASPDTYIHAHCYALEGLLPLRDGQPAGTEIVAAQRATCLNALAAGSQWLAEIQTAGGGLAAWHNGARPDGPCRADSTAQAIRIWAALGCAPFCHSIRGALAFLGRLQSPGGGMRYDTACSHINTWATVFAARAVAAIDCTSCPELTDSPSR